MNDGPQHVDRWRKWWIFGLSVVCLLAITAVATVCWDPYWFVEHGVDLYLDAHGVRHGYVTVDGYAIHYLEAGPAVNSAHPVPLILVHGLGANATDWAPLIPELAAHGYHIYALDLLGYGRSPKPSDGDFSLAAEERITLGFVRKMHLREFDLAGWSMGGWIATKMALDHPEMVRRLVLCDAAGLYFPIQFPLTLFAPPDRATLDEMVRLIEPDKPHIHIPAVAVPAILRRYRENKHIIDSSFGSMLTGREVLDFRMYRLRMPVLIVWGTEDKLTPYNLALRMHELVPQSVLLGLEGCGHLAPAECNRRVLPMTERFLDADPPLPATKIVLPAGR